MSAGAPAFRRNRIGVSTARTLVASCPLLLVLCCSAPTFAAGAAALSGQRSPAATLNGKAKLLFFTASWCAPCHRLQPFVEKICRQNKSVLELVIIEYDEYPAMVADFGVESLPTLILLDRSGKLRVRVNGASKEGLDVLSTEVKKLSRSTK